MNLNQIMQFGLSQHDAKKLLQQINVFVQQQLDQQLDKQLDQQLDQQQLNPKLEQKLQQKLEKALKQKLNEINNEHQKELQHLKFTSYIEKQLLLHGVKNVKAAMSLIDLDEFDFNNFDQENIKNKIVSLKENPETSFLFFQPYEQNKKAILRGLTPFDSDFKRTHKIDNMDYEQLCNYYDNFMNL